MQHTKIVLSLEAEKLKEHTAELISKHPCDALRVVYMQEETSNVLSFLKKYREEQEHTKDLIYKPIIIDVSHKTQGFTTNMSAPISVCYNTEITLVPEGSKDKGIEIKTKAWDSLFKEGENAYLNSGTVILSLIKVEAQKVSAVVKQGQVIQNDMTVTIPSTQKQPTVFDLAFIDTEPFLQLELDYIILPGIAKQSHLDLIKKKLGENKKHTPALLLKVDSLAVCKNIDALLDDVDGVVLSRRPLSLSVAPAMVPIICKEIALKASQKAKMVLVAGETLYSMRNNLTPTRAEISDIANATIDGIDAVILSKEIAYGKHTKQALIVAQKTIQDAENSTDLTVNWAKEGRKTKDHLGLITYQACKAAQHVKAKALVCLTKEGATALMIASFRPNIPILALTFEERTRRRVSLVRGVIPVLLKKKPSLDELLPIVNKALLSNNLLQCKDLFIFVTPSLSPISQETSNLFTIQEVT